MGVKEQYSKEMQRIETRLDELIQKRDRLLEKPEIKRHKAPMRSFGHLKDLKIACIMDEFTYSCFEPECNLLQLSREDWMSDILAFEPDILFLESAWRGKDNLWRNAIPFLHADVLNVISYCKKNNIPVAFWNKEDPVHFTLYLAVAIQADFIFTTDIGSISRYKAFAGHDRVFLLPFAAQPKIHNPVQKYERKDKACFAGSYYHKYPERSLVMNAFFDALKAWKGIDIYDRNYYDPNPGYKFPEEYSDLVIGNLKPEEIDKAYKGYRYGVTFNTVTTSKSMCARRVYELVASNTLTVSNECRAIGNYYGELVICTDSGDVLADQLRQIDAEGNYEKTVLLALRKTLTEHIYAQRLAYLAERISGQDIKTQTAGVLVVGEACDEKEARLLINSFNRQTYGAKRICVVWKGEKVPAFPMDSGITFIKDIRLLEAELVDAEYLAVFSICDYYGVNYLLDMMNALLYAESAVVCKNDYHTFTGGKTVRNGKPGQEYNYSGSAALRRAILRICSFSPQYLIELCSDIDRSEMPEESFSIDPWNYCENYPYDTCPDVDDIIANTGLPIAEFYREAEEIGADRLGRVVELNLREIFLTTPCPDAVQAVSTRDGVFIKSLLGTKEHAYLYMDSSFLIPDIASDDTFNVFTVIETNSPKSNKLCLIFLDENGARVDGVLLPFNKVSDVQIPPGAAKVKLGFRFYEKGTHRIKKIAIGNFFVDGDAF